MTVLDNNKMLAIADWQSEHFDALVKIPSHMHWGIAAYVVEGIEPGDFLRAIFENNLTLAAKTADHINQQHLFDYASLLHCAVPITCFGSPKAVRHWMASGGILGQEQKEPCSQ